MAEYPWELIGGYLESVLRPPAADSATGACIALVSFPSLQDAVLFAQIAEARMSNIHRRLRYFVIDKDNWDWTVCTPDLEDGKNCFVLCTVVSAITVPLDLHSARRIAARSIREVVQ